MLETQKQLKNFKKKFVKDLETGCLNWIGGKDTNGYGQFGINGKNQRAHRVAYETFAGTIPEGMYLDHKCRNIACINIEHLEPVTNAVNVQRGNSAKLNNALVIEIRTKYATGLYTYKELGQEYGIDFTHIGRIVRNKSWKVHNV